MAAGTSRSFLVTRGEDALALTLDYCLSRKARFKGLPTGFFVTPAFASVALNLNPERPTSQPSKERCNN